MPPGQVHKSDCVSKRDERSRRPRTEALAFLSGIPVQKRVAQVAAGPSGVVPAVQGPGTKRHGDRKKGQQKPVLFVSGKRAEDNDGPEHAKEGDGAESLGGSWLR